MHVELSHKTLHNFQCREIDCYNTYSIFDSYKKHRLFEHASQLLTFEDEKNAVSIKETGASFNDSENLNIDTDKPKLNVESDSSSHESDEIFDGTIFMSETSNASSEQNSNSFAEKIFLFTVKLYKFSDVPRARTNDIIADVSTLFKNNIEASHKEMRISLEQFGRDSLNLVKINTFLEKCLAPLRKLDTEFKRLAHFKLQGTFVILENYKLGDVKIIIEKEGEKEWKNKF